VRFFPLEMSNDPNKKIIEFIVSNKEGLSFDWIVVRMFFKLNNEYINLHVNQVGSNGIRAQYEFKQYIGRTADFVIKYSPKNILFIP
jgi:hypothetical protein